MKHLPFSITKKNDRRFYAVRFKNDKQGNIFQELAQKKKQKLFKQLLVG
jgi:hypothetical protein